MMRCHSPDVISCPIVLAVQDNVNVHDDGVQVGWGLCNYRSYRSLAAKPRCRRGTGASIPIRCVEDTSACGRGR